MISLSCYNLIKNNCTGACQGCSDCPAGYLHHEGVTNKKFRRATRWDMLKFAFDSKLEDLKWRIWFKMNSKKVKKIMRGSLTKRNLP